MKPASKLKLQTHLWASHGFTYVLGGKALTVCGRRVLIERMAKRKRPTCKVCLLRLTEYKANATGGLW